MKKGCHQRTALFHSCRLPAPPNQPLATARSPDYDYPMCWYCGSAIKDADPIGRSLRCPECGKDLRVCRHCRFYQAGGRGDCLETQAEPPQDKERGNFCDWFSLNTRFRAESPGEKGSRDQAASARSAFDNLFKT